MSTVAASIAQAHDAAPERRLYRVLHAACGEFATRNPQPGWRALLLTGSLARGESRWQRAGDRWLLAGDADLITVVASRNAARRYVSGLHEHLAAALEEAGVHADLSLGLMDPRALRRLPASIFTLELTTCGRILWGEPEVLRWAPRCTPAQIPREDAWRLLNNRIVECLAAVVEPNPAERLNRALDKLHAAIADSWLLFTGRYALGACQRLRRMESALAAGNGGLPWTHTPSLLASLRRAAARGPLPTEPRPTEATLRRLAAQTESAWTWELHQLGAERLSDAARRKEAGGGSLAWLAAAHAASNHQTRLRCLSRAMRPNAPSPRYCVYAAAAACWFSYPRLTDDARRAAARMPCPPPIGAGWEAVAAAIASNYRQWIEHTSR